MTTAERIIRLFRMRPLPAEGGFYVETYRAKESIPRAVLPEGYKTDRSLGTAILYLLTPDTLSSLHRIKGDEIFHFYLGDPVTMLQLSSDGTGRTICLGSDVLKGQSVQVLVPKNTWQGCFLNEGGSFALMGTAVAPGFEFDDFEKPDPRELLRKHPDQRALIARLTQIC